MEGFLAIAGLVIWLLVLYGASLLPGATLRWSQREVRELFEKNKHIERD